MTYRQRLSEVPGKGVKKLVDLDPSTADVLRSISKTTGMSQNAIVNQAIVDYASSVSLTTAASTPNSPTAAATLMTNYAHSLPTVHDQWTNAVNALAGKPEKEVG